MAADFGPPILDEPGIIGEIIKSEPVHGCTPLVGTNSGRFKGNIVVMRRGTCYFNLKVVNAQRAGAIAVVVSQEPENSQLLGTVRNYALSLIQPILSRSLRTALSS